MKNKDVYLDNIICLEHMSNNKEQIYKIARTSDVAWETTT